MLVYRTSNLFREAEYHLFFNSSYDAINKNACTSRKICFSPKLSNSLPWYEYLLTT